jgi:hypothetical protein
MKRFYRSIGRSLRRTFRRSKKKRGRKRTKKEKPKKTKRPKKRKTKKEKVKGMMDGAPGPPKPKKPKKKRPLSPDDSGASASPGGFGGFSGARASPGGFSGARASPGGFDSFDSPPVRFNSPPGASVDDTPGMIIPGGNILHFFNDGGPPLPVEIYIDFDDTFAPWEKMKGGTKIDLEIPVGAILENKTGETIACQKIGVIETDWGEGMFENNVQPVTNNTLAKEIKKKNLHLVDFIHFCLHRGLKVNIVSFNDHNLDQVRDLMQQGELFGIDGDSIMVVNKNTFSDYCGKDAPSSMQFKKRAHISMAKLLRDNEISVPETPEDEGINYAKMLKGAYEMDMKDKLLMEDSTDNISKHEGPCILFETEDPYHVKYSSHGGEWTVADRGPGSAAGGAVGGLFASPVVGGTPASAARGSAARGSAARGTPASAARGAGIGLFDSPPPARRLLASPAIAASGGASGGSGSLFNFPDLGATPVAGTRLTGDFSQLLKHDSPK